MCLGLTYESINVKPEMTLEEKLILLSGSFSDHVGYQRAENLTAGRQSGREHNLRV